MHGGDKSMQSVSRKTERKKKASEERAQIGEEQVD
jgi:hypothetical protein